MLQTEFVLGFFTALVLWGSHSLYRRTKTKKLQKEFDENWTGKQPYVQ